MHHAPAQSVEPTSGNTWSLPARLKNQPRIAHLLHRLMGPRYVDLPIRVLTLVYSLSTVASHNTANSEPSQLALHYGSCALVALAAFLPRSVGIIALALLLPFTLAYPGLENPFLVPVEFAGMVLLSMLRWKWCVLLFALEVGAITFAINAGSSDLITMRDSILAWALNAPYALAAYLLESRIQREVSRREHTARKSEREIHNARLRFATDAHDTVSHGLATQSAILRLMEHSHTPKDVGHKVKQLAEINAETQQQLRMLLTRLSTVPAPNPGPHMPVEELRRTVESMCETSVVRGVPIVVSIKDLPETIPAEFGVHVIYAARELVTNLVKHSEPQGNRRIALSYRRGESNDWIVLESKNTVKTPSHTAPRTLTARARELGGSCRVEHSGPTRKTIVRLPISAAASGTTS